jgi:hypothetical protein
MTPSLGITDSRPVIPIHMERRFSKRDGQDKPGHDDEGLTPAVILPILWIGPASAAREGEREAPGGGRNVKAPRSSEKLIG